MLLSVFHMFRIEAGLCIYLFYRYMDHFYYNAFLLLIFFLLSQTSDATARCSS